MLDDSDFHEASGGSRSGPSKRLEAKREEWARLVARRDDLLTKLCRTQIRLQAVTRSLARMSKTRHG